MANSLVIVESPAKVKTIKKFLGSTYEVDASNGHVRDLPKSQLGIDVENDYEPKYITIRGKGDILAKLRKEVKKADKIYLATDPDREGEAISWHLMKALKLDEVKDKKVYWAAQESDITGVIPQEVSFEDEEVYKEVHKVLCMGDKEDIAALEQQLVKEFPQIRIYRSKDTYLEIMSMKASKSDAIHMLKDHFHVKQEEIMAFGDNFNDIDMIRYAGLGVAMGNAADEVKEAADIVTDINDNEGERQILDKYFR